jgi:hypothetical protein
LLPLYISTLPLRPLPGLHKHGLSNDKLSKRYIFMLDTIVKARVGKRKVDAPPKLLYVRELVAALPPALYEQLELLVRVPGLAKHAAAPAAASPPAALSFLRLHRSAHRF